MQAGGDGNGEALGRLPPGRHGLSREFVTRNQRERLIAGTIVAVAEHGYRDASVGRIAAAAGVSRQTFYDYFSTKEECYVACYDLFESHALEAVRDAGVGERGWTATVDARVGALLAILDANPDLVRFGLVAPPATGEELLGRERRFLENLIGGLSAGRPRSSSLEPSEIELEAMAGGLAALLVARVEEGEHAEFASLRPTLVELVLAPFLGRGRAAEQARKDPAAG
jgi:AcrR family transcriptional regulator